MTDHASLSESAGPAAWLRAYAPDAHDLLGPPADPAAVEGAQVRMGLRFPPTCWPRSPATTG
jgi:hypothetical protein